MKYKLIDVNEFMVTRNVYLQNEITGKTEKYFDDSDMTQHEDFSFMKIGETYDCKIQLFGHMVDRKGENILECIITNRNVVVGNYVVIEVLVDGIIYYVSKADVEEDFKGDKFYFDSSRKDLIQVDEHIHGSFLE